MSSYNNVNNLKEEIYMREFLNTYYGIQVNGEVEINGRLGYPDHEYVYFTISSNNNKAIHMEQATLAYYLVENGYPQTAFPIPNLNGEWITTIEKHNYIVVKVKSLQNDILISHGEMLANFHQRNMAYNYEPQYVSSYGQWKQLWIDKLTFFEKHITDLATKKPNSFFRLLMDVLPYMIGISENAIQYMQESEFENRYDEADQGTIAFHRYQDQLLTSIIWPDDLVYDHISRDLAEYIRHQFIANNDLENILNFLNDYESILPVTVFSWRLLYARLLYPIHLYDFIAEILRAEEFDQAKETFEDLIESQMKYEKKLKKLFSDVMTTNKTLQIPTVHWL